MKYLRSNKRFAANRGARIAAALLVLTVVGCANTQDTTGLESSIARAEDGDFGLCMKLSYLAAVELQEAKARLEELKIGPSDTDMREGMRAAKMAQENREKAERVCANEHRKASERDAARIAELQAQQAELNTRLKELETRREVLHGVTFATGSSTLSGGAQKVLLSQVSNIARGGDRILVAGYASAVGGENYNLQLSQKRADAVRDFLVRHGVVATTIQAKGFGTADPVASNSTADGRLANQRIELQYLK